MSTTPVSRQKFKKICITLLMFSLLLILILPTIFLIINFFTPFTENFRPIIDYLLVLYIVDTFVIVFGSAFVALILGFTFSYYVCFYNFKGRKIISSLIILPLAIPSYILAYNYVELFNFTGVIYSFFRNQFGIMLPPNFIRIASPGGAIFIFSISLYPYIYLISKPFLEKQGASLVESSRLIGKSNFHIFKSIILPISTPVLIGATTIVALDVLNDFGVSSFLGLNTFSMLIFQTWIGMGDLNSAIKLSIFVFLTILTLISISKYFQNSKKYMLLNTRSKQHSLVQLKGLNKFIFYTLVFIVLSLGFVIPIMQMIYWATLTWQRSINSSNILLYTFNTLWLSLATSFIVTTFSILIVSFVKYSNNKKFKVLFSFTKGGYVLSTSVLAIGVLSLFTNLNYVQINIHSFLGLNAPFPVISMTIYMLLFALVVRFFSLGYESVDSSYAKIGNIYSQSSNLLGYSNFKTFFKVDLHLIKSGILSGFILTFIATTKELGLTALLRPFNFETLATITHKYARDEMVQMTAIPSLILITITASFIFLMRHKAFRGDTDDTTS
jgi:iron(III) transport system permease protein